jgi:GNAT superfamily N-acetyltransferase
MMDSEVINEMVTIKRGTIEDVDSLLRLSKKLFDEVGHQFSVPDNNQAMALYRDLLNNEHYVVFIASDSQHPACGFITLNEGASIYAGGKFGLIQEFYVVEQKRSCGIGKTLLHNATEFAQSKGWKRLEVTPPHREKSRRTYNFYMREGFVEIGPRLKLENLNE